MKRWIACFLLLAVLSLCLIGCGDKEPEKKHYKDPSEQTTAEPGTTVAETTASTAGEIDKELPKIPVDD